MPKVKIEDSRGLVIEAGKGFEVQAPPTFTKNTLNSASASIAPGLNVIPAGTAATTFVFPTASDHPGQTFIISNHTANPHVLTASNVPTTPTGFNTICDGNTGLATGNGGNYGVAEGQRITFGNAATTTSKYGSITLVCDGFSYAVLTSSGSFVISTTV